jgi:cytochrome c peroxidase
MRGRAVSVSFFSFALLACGSPMPERDGGATDSSPATDADANAPEDASDGGCTLRPGDLPGDRRVASAALFPDLTFETETGTTALHDFHVPCAPRPELIVVRSLAAWSGHSGWHVANTARLLAHPERARLHFVDVLVEDVDGSPARASDLTAFAARYDAMPDALGIDPDERLGALALVGIRLPVVVLLDARDLRAVRTLFAPRAGEIEHEIDRALAMLDGEPPPAPFDPALVDGRFSEDEWDLIEGMAYPAAPPSDPSNAHADDPAAAALGATLFDDTGLSPSGVGCRSCHQAASAFTDTLPVGHGVSDVTRNTPTIVASAFVRWPFWDGRVDSLWAQALGPTESAREMGSSRLFVAHRLWDTHRTAYETVFGALPLLDDVARFPASGTPGDAAWEAMAPSDQDAIDRVFSNYGKAIEAFERTVSPPPTAFDAYVAGDPTALTELERDGLRELLRDGCVDCHHGPALSDGAFHAIDMPGFGTGAEADVGRLAALEALETSRFRRQGAYSDAPSTPDPIAGVTSFDASTTGAFRTPTLRALSLTAPYGHAGTFATLHDVVSHYARITMPSDPDPRVTGDLDAHIVGFDDVPARVDPMTAFLGTL